MIDFTAHFTNQVKHGNWMCDQVKMLAGEAQEKFLEFNKMGK